MSKVSKKEYDETMKVYNAIQKDMGAKSRAQVKEIADGNAMNAETKKLNDALKVGLISSRDEVKNWQARIKAGEKFVLPTQEEPKKKGRPAKSKPSNEPIELDRNEYAHARIRRDDEYMAIIKELRYNEKITASQMNNMMGDLEDNKYDKLEKALSKYTTAKPVLHIPVRERSPSPEPAPAPKKRGRPSKQIDTTELKALMNEINEHKKHNPVTLASIPDFPKFPKAPKPVKEPRSEIKSLKNNIKNKAKRMISGIEHSDLMKYISQF